MAANDNQAFEGREAFRVGLTEWSSRRRRRDDRAPLAGRCRGEDRVEDTGDGLDAKHHTGPAAVGPVVGALPRSERVEQIMQANLDQAALLRPAEDRKSDRGCEHLREERDDVDA